MAALKMRIHRNSLNEILDLIKSEKQQIMQDISKLMEQLKKHKAAYAEAVRPKSFGSRAKTKAPAAR